MADKTTTLKTKTNDNVYPNVIGDNRKNAFVDSSTITHHFYDQTHKVGFQIANETNKKIQNSLQKPAGLTKTKLVGVGANGQENIEIGDNLTLANGKLSATGGGSGGDAFDTIVLSDDKTTYTGTITGERPVLLKIKDGTILPIQNYNADMDFAFSINFGSGSIIYLDFYMLMSGSVIYNKLLLGATYFSHFITLTNDNDKIYLMYENTSDNTLYMDTLEEALSGKKVLCTGVLGNSDETLATPLYVSGEGGGLEVYYVLKNDTSGTISHKSIIAFMINDEFTQVE